MIKIGITKTESSKKDALYYDWIKDNEENIDIIPLSYLDDNLNDMEQCDAIILSGGIDTHPSFYDNTRTDYPGAPENFLNERDTFEIAVFNYANENKLPVLGVCRGMQLLNIILKGDILQDLEEGGKQSHSQVDEKDSHHEVTVERDSLLFQIAGAEKGEINSAHHQGLGKVSDELIVSAFSPDGVPEAVEYRDKTDKPFMLGVQWHPERLKINEATLPFTKKY